MNVVIVDLAKMLLTLIFRMEGPDVMATPYLQRQGWFADSSKAITGAGPSFASC